MYKNTRKKLGKVLLFGAIAVAASVVLRVTVLKTDKKKSTLTSSTLTEAINISELSTAEFTYRGIAEVYGEKDPKKLTCRVCYNAVIKAGIDMKKVVFEIDPENKKVAAILPPIDLKVNIIDEQSMAVLPSNAEIGVDLMLKASKADSEEEAKNSQELFKVARENTQSAIRGLLLPILEPEGYSLIFKEQEPPAEEPAGTEAPAQEEVL